MTASSWLEYNWRTFKIKGYKYPFMLLLKASFRWLYLLFDHATIVIEEAIILRQVQKLDSGVEIIASQLTQDDTSLQLADLALNIKP